LKSRHLKLHPINKLDENFSIYMNHLFSEGIDVSEGFKTLAALVDARPDASQKGDLPRARRCLQEWAKLDPARTKPPMGYPFTFDLRGYKGRMLWVPQGRILIWH